MNDIRRAMTVAALAAIVLHGCGSSGSETAGIDAGGVQEPVTTQGPITGFGSIIVGGVHYDIDRAQISVNGAPAAAADLALGQLVTISGERAADGTAGTADSVAFDANVEGPVQAVDAPAGTLVVLGQPVTTTAETIFDLPARPSEIGAIAVGDRVQVSGFVGGGGDLAATRITLLPPGRLRVRGTVADLDRSTTRFELNDLTVDYRAAFVIEGFPGGAPSNGDEVVVLGSALSPSGALQAEALERVGESFAPDPGDEAEVEGLITRVVSPTEFDVAGVPISAGPATAYEGGTAANLLLNVKVKVDGRVNDAGVIEARKIEVKDGGRIVGGP